MLSCRPIAVIGNIEREVIRKSREHRSLLIHVEAVSIAAEHNCIRVATSPSTHTSDEQQAARLHLAHLSRQATP